MAAGGLLAVWEVSDGDPAVLSGYRADARFDVDLPPGWEVRGTGRFGADVAASEIARTDASVRIDVDGRPMGAWTPAEPPGPLTIPLAAELFDEGGFSIEAVSTSPIINEQACLDPNHVARWVDLGAPTVRATIAPRDLDIARAVAGLGRVSALTGEPITLAIEGEREPGTLEAVGAIVAAVGQGGTPAGWHLPIAGAPQVPGARIHIRPSNATARIDLTTIADRPVLTLSGQPTGMAELAHALADPDRILFFHHTERTAAQIPAGLVQPPSEVFSFEAAGYDDRTLRGFGTQALVYRLHLPAGLPPDSATLALFGTFSPALAEHEATVSVRINGSAEEIVAVTDTTAQLRALHTVTPADLRPGLNYVKLETQLGSAANTGCAGGDTPNWFTVSNDSAVGVEQPSSPQPVQIGVQDARFSLATMSDFLQTDVAIGDPTNPAELQVALDVITELGRRSQGGSPRLITDAGADRSRHLVVVGSAGERELAAHLPYLRPGASVAVVAAVPSPFEPGRVYLAFTGETAQDSALAAAAGLSSAVNDMANPYALVSRDAVRGVGAVPVGRSGVDQPTGPLAFGEDGRVAGPTPAEYDEWLLDQAAQIEAANEPERDRRRATALVLGLAIATLAGLWWLRRTRANDDVTDAH